MTQWLKAPVTLSDDLGSFPNTHMMIHNHLIEKIQCPLLILSHEACIQYTYVHTDKAIIHIK